jgi:hypothetical protein
MKRAEKLLEIRDVLIAGPLTTDQLAEFYKEELRKVRGEDIITEFARDLIEDAVATPRRWRRQVHGVFAPRTATYRGVRGSLPQRPNGVESRTLSLP